MALTAWLAIFAGALLVYAGMTGESIVDRLRDIFTGAGKAGSGAGGGRAMVA